MVKNVVMAILCFMAMGNIVYADMPSDQRDALIKLYEKTNGANWNCNDGWKDAAEETECGWFGVECDRQDNVTKIRLINNNLEGFLPPELGALSKLTELNLESNKLTEDNESGQIPSELGNLSSLKLLNLSYNKFKKYIPVEFGQFGSLEEMYLNNNDFRNGIPDELGNLLALEVLDLSDNEKLNGDIPDELGQLTLLKELDLSNALLQNSVPEELFALTALEILDLGFNELDFQDTFNGGVSGDRSNLVYLDISSNKLRAIPGELGNLSRLEELYISECPILSGEISDNLKNLSNLTILDISSNENLTCEIPAMLENLTKLTELNLSKNNLTGNIPSSLGQLKELRILDLGSNLFLEGAIPSELGGLTNLTQLDLSSNKLKETIPDTPWKLANLTNLTKLDLSSNKLDGPIPSDIEALIHLKELDLSCNAFKGSIPLDPGIHSDLSEINLDYNACYAESEALGAFIADRAVDKNEEKDPEWEKKQTVAPKGLVVTGASQDSISIKWTPISYTGDPGGYEVWYSTQETGLPYQLSGTTADNGGKAAGTFTLTGLASNTSYYIKLKTVTRDNTNNQNEVSSEESSVLAASTGYTVTFRAEANGSISGPSFQIVKEGNSCSSVTAVPAQGYHFAGWSGDCAGTANPMTVRNVGSDMEATARFEKDAVPVQESGGGGGGGGGCFIGALGN